MAIETKVTIDGRRIICKGTFVYRTPEEESDMLDPGLVMTGTKCGHNHVSAGPRASSPAPPPGSSPVTPLHWVHPTHTAGTV